MRKAWRELPSPAEPFQLALAARSELEDEEIAQLLAERREALNARLAHMDELARSAPAPEMAERQRALTLSELRWLDDLIGEEE